MVSVTSQVDVAGECVFCGIVAGTVPCAKVAEDAATFAFMDIDPGSDGHLLVIPKRHSADLVEISADDLAAMTLAAQRIAKVILAELGCRWRQPTQLLRRRSLANCVPFPPACDPALSR